MKSVSFSIKRVNRLQRTAAAARARKVSVEDPDLWPVGSPSNGWFARSYDANDLMHSIRYGSRRGSPCMPTMSTGKVVTATASSGRCRLMPGWWPQANVPEARIEGQILTGPLFNEPMRVETVTETGPGSWSLGLVGTRPERFRRVALGAAELAGLTALDSGFRYDGDGALLRLGLQAHALGIAWECDPYFGLSVSRVDPLPHQLEAVYDHLLKLARVRFLLADDAGAGKTIMAGLLIRELQLRGLAERILIVAPSNLAFQWQRELQEKFDETFMVLKRGELRTQFGVKQWMQQPKVVTSLDLAKREEILPGLQQARWGPGGGGRGPPDVGP